MLEGQGVAKDANNFSPSIFAAFRVFRGHIPFVGQPVTGVAPAGRRSVNVVPLPGSLAMSIVPE